MNKCNLFALGFCYTLGLIVSVTGALYILMHSGGHGGGRAMWYDLLLVPGIYIAAMFPPDSAYLAIAIYTAVIGSVVYVPLKIIFKW